MINFKFKYMPINRVVINLYKNKSKLGFCSLDNNFIFNSTYLYNLNIMPNHRGNNYSKILLDKVFEYNNKIFDYDNNYNNIYLHVDKKNQIALNLYLKMGFKIEADSNNILLMKKSNSYTNI